MLVPLTLQVLELVLNLTLALNGLAETAALVIIGWLTTMLSLSMITTMWGHFVEGRALR